MLALITMNRTVSNPSPSPQTGRALLRKMQAVDADVLLDELSDRQFLVPRKSLGDVLLDATHKLHLCPQATTRSLSWLGINRDVLIGRMRRTELVQLARCLSRFNRHLAGRQSCQSD